MKLIQAFLPLVLFGLCYGQFKRVCYFAGWARYAGKDPQPPEEIDVSLCTHILYSFATLDNSAVHIKATDAGDDPEIYRRFTQLKNRNSHLKTMLSLGGWSMGSHLFHELVNTPQNIHSFAQNAVSFLRSHNFDGLDIDWEYPAARGSPAPDKQKFTQLLQAVHTAFANEAQSSGKPRLLLTTALAPSPGQASQSYELPKIADYLDFINLMTYDMHGTWDQPLVTGHNSPLYAPKPGDNLNVDYLVSYWAKTGIPKNKIIVGVPLYGHSYTINDAAHHINVGTPASGPGKAGTSGEEGSLTYKEICLIVKSGAGTVHRLEAAKVPVLIEGNRWTGFDDPQSVREKAHYVKDHGYGGVMVWSLDQDDFKGHCGPKWPLMTAIKEVLGGGTDVVG